MANAEHLRELSNGPKRWMEWRAEHGNEVPDLRNADLSDQSLVGADLRRADLSFANLERSDLTRAMLGSAVLYGTNLNFAIADYADLRDADLRLLRAHWTLLHGANLDRAVATKAEFVGARLGRATLRATALTAANLREAVLTSTVLSKTMLDGADLTRAVLHGTVLADLDLRCVAGLETLNHRAPSSLGFDTLLRSEGKIPHAFLLGVGVPDTVVRYAHSLLVNPVEYYSCFISYSTLDQAFADRLHADLQAAGVRCWFAPHDIEAGRKLHEQIDEAIRIYDKLLLILSPASITSKWVKEEILNAWAREQRENRRMLFPIALTRLEELRAWKCFDADSGRDVAREIREYFIPNFSAWKTDHDEYKRAFGRVVKSLGEKRASAEVPGAAE